MCVHTLPRPAVQLQWVQQTWPDSSKIIHTRNGVLLIICEWRTYTHRYVVKPQHTVYNAAYTHTVCS